MVRSAGCELDPCLLIPLLIHPSLHIEWHIVARTSSPDASYRASAGLSSSDGAAEDIAEAVDAFIECFKRARREDVQSLLETLDAMGVARKTEDWAFVG